MKRVERIRCMMNEKLVMEGKRGETVEGETFFYSPQAKYITIKKEKEGLLLTIETRIEDESPKKPLKEIVSM